MPRSILAALCILGLLAVSARADDAPTVRIDDLGLGTYWFGPEIGHADLEGKVVLFVMWGSTTGCRQITPHMIRLAERLEGKPFHLVASHCEDISSKDEEIAYLKANGLSPYTPDLTVLKEARHPGIKGTGGAVPKYPYYAIFDQSGALVHQGLGGTYFGGDGLAFVDLTEKAVAAADPIWVGAAPYGRHADLAHALAKGRSIAGTAKKVEALLQTETDAGGKAELERLQAVLTRYRDRQLAYARLLEGTHPSDVVKALRGLASDLKGTALAAPVEAALAEQSRSARLKAAIAIEKKFRSTKKAFERVKESKRDQAFIDRTVQKLEKLIEGKEDLPIAKTVDAFLANLR